MNYLSRILWLIILERISCTFVTKKNASISHEPGDDYYSNYDYELSNGNMTQIDSLILPKPPDFPETDVDTLPEIALPSDSLADSDLRDHDYIDNLMYIYSGNDGSLSSVAHGKNGVNNTFGSHIIIAGAALSLVAQLLTILCTLLHRRIRNKQLNLNKDVHQIFLHMIVSLCLANFVFMIGVYATRNPRKCQIVALVLHYLHLLAPFWIFIHCYYIYKKFSTDYVLKLRYFYLFTYTVPFVLVLFSYGMSAHSYETKQFCFVSIQKGMVLNYMLPVSILIIATTILSLNGIRLINFELSKLEISSSSESLNAFTRFDQTGKPIDPVQVEKQRVGIIEPDEYMCQYLKQLKGSLQIVSLVQTSYDVVWFILVLALENGTFSSVMPILYVIASCSLNWYIFAKSKSFTPNIYNRDMEQLEKNNDNNDRDHDHDYHNTNKEQHLLLQSTSRCSSSDDIPDIPLLNNGTTTVDNSYTELRELIRHDAISTISS